MSQNMSPSEKGITPGQAGKLADLMISALRKSNLRSDTTQVAIELWGAEIAAHCLEVIDKYQYLIDNGFEERGVKVNRHQTPEELIAKIGLPTWPPTENDPEVTAWLANMPCGEGGKKDVKFFPVYEMVDAKGLAKLFEYHNMKPDPYAVAACMERLSPEYSPVVAPWQDANGTWFYIGFGWHHLGNGESHLKTGYYTGWFGADDEDMYTGIKTTDNDLGLIVGGVPK